MRQYLLFLGVRCNFHHVFTFAGKAAQVSWLEVCRNTATASELCKQVSAVPLSVLSMSLHIDMNMILTAKDSGFTRSDVSEYAS